MKTGSKTGTLPYLSNILTSYMKLREKEPEKKVPATWELFCEDGNLFEKVRKIGIFRFEDL